MDQYKTNPWAIVSAVLITAVIAGGAVYWYTDSQEALTSEQQSAKTKCAELKGESYLALSELYGVNQIFCKFEGEGECTQNELNDGVCFKDK